MALELIPRLFEFKDDEIVICASDLQKMKAEFPIEVTDDGIVICVSDLQKMKADSPIEVTDDGIVICVSDEHPSNEPLKPLLYISFTLESILTMSIILLLRNS